MAQKAQSVIKGKKSWHHIVAPPMFKDMVLGETTVYEPSQMIGKRIEFNLMNLTGDIKRQNINLTFQVTDVKDGKGITSVMAYTMIPGSVKRLVRRRSDRVDLSFACETADNKVVRIKPLVVTRGNTTSVIQRKLHHYAMDYVLRQVKRLTFEQLLNELVTYKFQSEMRAKLAKVYPLKSSEVRSLSIADPSEKVIKVTLSPEPVAKEEPQQEVQAESS